MSCVTKNVAADETAGSSQAVVDTELVTEEFEPDFINEIHENNSDNTESEASG